MSKAEKLLNRFLQKPTDFTYDELRKLLKAFGYEEIKTGKTSGSLSPNFLIGERVTFYNAKTEHIIKLHKPHPKPVLKHYQLNDIEDALKKEGLIK